MEQNSTGNAQGRMLPPSGTITRQVLAAIVGTDGQVVRIADLLVSETLLHKSADGRGTPFPGQTYPTVSVTGMPSAV